MERESLENTSKVVKDIGNSSKKKGPSDYYFWVIDEVKNAYSLYFNQYILDHLLRDYKIAHLRREHFIKCLPCKPNN